MFNESFILASSSPRRKELLGKAGYRFEVVVPDVDEGAFGGEGIGACEFTELLAKEKAKAVAQKFPDSLVIGADTVADFNGQIIGKALDANHAEQITRKLFSGPHKIVTGVAIVWLSAGIEMVRSDVTVVYPKKMTAEQIAEHIKHGSWEGKAGAYAIQETGDEFVEKIDGSLTNVMGLPMEMLERMLESIGSR